MARDRLAPRDFDAVSDFPSGIPPAGARSAAGATSPCRLNIGCGRSPMAGWINVDSASLPGVDIVCDLETVRGSPIPLPDDSVDEFLLSHVIEHIRDSLGLMQELWRLARPGAISAIRCPYGGSDAAWEDQTHVRAYFVGSFGFFSQPHYWRGDYGYRGDWQPEVIRLLVEGRRLEGLDPAQCYEKVQGGRNLVREMICEMRAVKPARECRRELIVPPRIEIVRVD